MSPGPWSAQDLKAHKHLLYMRMFARSQLSEASRPRVHRKLHLMTALHAHDQACPEVTYLGRTRGQLVAMTATMIIATAQDHF